MFSRCTAVLAIASLPALLQAQARGTPAGPPLSQALDQPPLARPQLALARIVVDQPVPDMGGVEGDIYRPRLRARFVWQGAGTNVVWVYQVADRPFADTPDLSPDGLLHTGSVPGSAFDIDFESFPPLGVAPVRGFVRQVPQEQTTAPTARAVQPADAARERPRTFYVRILPLQAGTPAGLASNPVVVHFRPGPDPADDRARNAITTGQAAAEAAAALESARQVYSATFVSFRPAIFPDPNRWGCVRVVKNPYAQQLLHPLLGFMPGQEYCGRSYKGAGYHATGLWDYAAGWVKVYEIIQTFYDGTKSWMAEKFAGAVPCKWLGEDAEHDCHDAAAALAGEGLSAGLAAAGLPPSLPSLGALKNTAKGDVVDAAVEYTCASIESQGGECTPGMREALHDAYQYGLDKLEQEVTEQATEPGCGDTEEAHAHGREPLPCFLQYPGVEISAATGSVYQPPIAVIRVSRVKQDPPAPVTDCRLRLDLWLHNHFSGGYLQGASVNPADLDGAPYEDEYQPVPPLALGHSADLTVTLLRIRPFVVPGHFVQPTPGTSDDWWRLWYGGHGEAIAALVGASGTTSCGTAGVQPVSIP